MGHPGDSHCPIADEFPEDFGEANGVCTFGTPYTTDDGSEVICLSSNPGYHPGLETTGKIQCTARDVLRWRMEAPAPREAGALFFSDG